MHRRHRLTDPRTHRVTVRFSAAELLTISVAAATDRLAVGAWVADVATRVAAGDRSRAEISQLRAMLAELAQARTQLAKAGGLLNQAVVAFHVGEPQHRQIAAAASYVAGRIQIVDRNVAALVQRLP